MSSRRKKQLLENINRLTNTEHDEIFKVMKMHHIPFTQNKNGVFFNLLHVDDGIIEIIGNFVDFCLKNKTELDEYDKKINECKISNKYDVIVNKNNDTDSFAKSLDLVLIEETKADDWQTIAADIKSSEKLTALVVLLETNLEKIHKKKANSKFITAKKRYSRKLVSDKKNEAELMSNLIEESYINLA
jgi:hypothetical protein